MNSHDELRSLLGAYALDAVSASERRSVERHIETCDDCAREVRLLGGSASELAFLAGEEELSADLVERIVSVPARLRPPRRWMRPVAAAAAAVVLVVAGLVGTDYVRESSERAGLSRIVEAAEKEVRLEPVAGFPARGTVYLTDDKAALVIDALPPAGRDRAFQLWSLRGGTPSSMAVFDEHGRVVKVIDWRKGGDAFAMTLEPAGGSKRPTTQPVLSGTA